jgi:hypothetical protein
MRWALVSLLLAGCSTPYGEEPASVNEHSEPVASAAVTTVPSSPAPPTSPSGEACFVTTGSMPLTNAFISTFANGDLDIAPDLSRLVYSDGTGIFVAGLDAKNPKQVLARAGVKSLSFLGNTRVVFVQDGLVVLDLATSKTTSIDLDDLDAGLAVQVAASRGGDRLAFTADPTGGVRTSTYVVDFDGTSLGTHLKRLSQGTTDADPTFRGQEVLVARDGDIVVLGEREAPLLHDPCGEHRFRRPRASKDGNNLVFLHDLAGKTDLGRAEADGSNPNDGWKVLLFDETTGAHAFDVAE